MSFLAQKERDDLLVGMLELWYAALPARDRNNLESTWIGKTTVTFSDAITLVRRDLWRRWFFATPAFKAVVQKLTHTETPTLPHPHAGDAMAKVEMRSP